jgi:hypothetical protein
MRRTDFRYQDASSAKPWQAIASRCRFIHSACTAGIVLAAALAIATGADAQRAGGGRGQQDAPAAPPGGPIYTASSPAMNISGVWWTQSYSPKIQVMGGELPLNEKGSAQYARNMAGLKDGTLKDEARHLCVPDGLPRILGNPYPFQLIQTPGRVTFVYELNHVIRPIPLDKPKLSAEELEVAPYYSGHSVAHWDGDTLAIETAGFNEKTFLDATGAPHSNMMTTVEQVRKVNERTLEDLITVTDPEMFTKPWSARFVYDLHPEVRLEDYVCGEKHRDISKVQGVVVPK